MRRAAVAVAVAALALAAGCAGGVSEERLAENATYAWDVDANATVNVTGSEYHAVYRVTGPLEVYRTDDIGGEQPVPIAALKFRYPNGTVVGAESLSVEETDSRVTVTPPGPGLLAYTGVTPPKSFATPALVEGSHEVVLPPDIRISAPLLGIASPGGFDHSIGPDDRVHLRWDDLEAGTDISLQYYLERDLYIFGGLVVLLLVAAVLGVVYFRYQLGRLRRLREAADDEG